jgi:hypothetical protein
MPSKGSFENDTQKFVRSFSGNVFKCFLQFNGYLIELQKDHEDVSSTQKFVTSFPGFFSTGFGSSMVTCPNF